MSKRKRSRSSERGQTLKRSIDFGALTTLSVYATDAENENKQRKHEIKIHPSVWEMNSEISLTALKEDIHIPFSLDKFTLFLRYCYQMPSVLPREEYVYLWYFAIQFKVPALLQTVASTIELVWRSYSHEDYLSQLVLLQHAQHSELQVAPHFSGFTESLLLRLWIKFVCLTHGLVREPLLRQGRQKAFPVPTTAEATIVLICDQLFPMNKGLEDHNPKLLVKHIHFVLRIFAMVDYYRCQVESLFDSYRRIQTQVSFMEVETELRKQLPSIYKQQENLSLLLKGIKDVDQVNKALLQCKWAPNMSTLSILYALRHPQFRAIDPSATTGSIFLSDWIGIEILMRLGHSGLDKTTINEIIHAIIPLLSNRIACLRKEFLFHTWTVLAEQLGSFDFQTASTKIPSKTTTTTTTQQRDNKYKVETLPEWPDITDDDENNLDWSFPDRTHESIPIRQQNDGGENEKKDNKNEERKTTWHPKQYFTEQTEELLRQRALLVDQKENKETNPFEARHSLSPGMIPTEISDNSRILLRQFALLAYPVCPYSTQPSDRALFKWIDTLSIEERESLIASFAKPPVLPLTDTQVIARIFGQVMGDCSSVKAPIPQVKHVSHVVFDLAGRSKLVPPPQFRPSKLNADAITERWNDWILRLTQEHLTDKIGNRVCWEMLIDVPYEQLTTHDSLWECLSKWYEYVTDVPLKTLIRWIVQFKLHKLTQVFLRSRRFNLSIFNFTHEDYHYFYADRLRSVLPPEPRSIQLPCEKEDCSRREQQQQQQQNRVYKIGQIIEVFDLNWGSQERPWCPAEIIDIRMNVEDNKEHVHFRYIGWRKEYQKSLSATDRNIAVLGTHTSVDMLIYPTITENDRQTCAKIEEALKLQREQAPGVLGDLDDEDDDDVGLEPLGQVLGQVVGLLNNQVIQAAHVANAAPQPQPQAQPAPPVPPGHL